MAFGQYKSTTRGINRESIDESTGAVISIGHDVHQMHEGNHFYIEGCTTLASGDTLYVRLVTPNSTKRSHFLWDMSSSNILTTYLYEDASGGMTGGAAVTPLNNNRNSTDTSLNVITSGISTATDDGTLISQSCWGSRQAGGSQNRRDELILKQNTTYLRKLISGANSNLVAFKAIWHEHTDKVP